MNGTHWLAVNGLSLTEGSTRIIDDASLRFGAQHTVVLGPNGAGKSTLLHLLGGLDSPTRGEVELLGRALADLTETECGEERAKASVHRRIPHKSGGMAAVKLIRR